MIMEEYLYIANIGMVPLLVGFKMEEILKWRGLKLQGPLHIIHNRILIRILYILAFFIKAKLHDKIYIQNTDEHFQNAKCSKKTHTLRTTLLL